MIVDLKILIGISLYQNMFFLFVRYFFSQYRYEETVYDVKSVAVYTDTESYWRFYNALGPGSKNNVFYLLIKKFKNLNKIEF